MSNELTRTEVRTERISLPVLNALLNDENVPDDVKTQLIKIQKGCDKNTELLTVKYTPSKNAETYGRLFANRGLQNLKSLFRNALAYENYYDVDMVNAQPNILRQFLLKYFTQLNIHSEVLDDYCDNRQRVIDMISTEQNIPKTEVKTDVVIAIINGRTLQTLHDKYKLKRDTDSYEWIKQLIADCDNIRNTISKWSSHPLISFIQKSRNTKCQPNRKTEYKRWLISMLLSNIENTILHSIDIHLKRYSFNTATLMFDGLYVAKQSTNGVNLTQQILDEVRASVKDDLFYDIPLIMKPMDDNRAIVDIDTSSTDTTNIYTPLENDTWLPNPKYCDRFDTRYASKIPFKTPREEYQRKKRYIELFYAYVRSLNAFICYSPRYDSETFTNKNHIELILAPVINPQLWFSDPYAKHYDNIDYLPYAVGKKQLMNEYTYNYFKGFHPATCRPVSCGPDILQPYYQLLSAMCEDNEVIVKYVECWLANLIQNPAEKNGIALIITGDQGSGKNMFVDMISTLIGSKNYHSTADINTILGSHATGLNHKLLINLDEVNISNTASYTEQIKQLITAPRVTINQKFVTQFEINLPARFIFTTNNPNPIRVDVKSRDRRFLVMRSSNRLRDTYTKNDWLSVMHTIKSDAFVNALYHHLAAIDCSNVNWIADRPNTKARDLLYESSTPSHILFLEEFLTTKYGSEDLLKLNRQDTIDLSRNELFLSYKRWLELNGHDEGKQPTQQAFTTRLKGLELGFVDTKIKGNRSYRFNPFTILDMLYEKFAYLKMD